MRNLGDTTSSRLWQAEWEWENFVEILHGKWLKEYEVNCHVIVYLYVQNM